MSRSHVSYSVVMEMENGRTVSWLEVGECLRALEREIRSVAVVGEARPSVYLVNPGEATDAQLLQDGIRREAPGLEDVARVHYLSVPDGRYYELKNAGIAHADSEVIVLLDSDNCPETGWLNALLAPFSDANTVAVNGHTYLQHGGFVSRVFALIWFFPLRDNDVRDAQRRALNANNCTFRADWIKAHPFPIDNGFKVGCTKLMHQLRQSGHETMRVPAYCAHLPLHGWRFLVWRALVTGRDADRKFADMKSPSRARRLLHTFKYALKMHARAARRVLLHYRHVTMPVWEVPAALALGFAFYSLAFCGQLGRSLGLAADRREHVPAYAEHH